MSISAEDRVDNLRAMPATPGLSWIGRLLQATSAGRVVAVTLLVVLLTFLSVYPLSMLLYGSLHSTPPGMAGTFNLDGYLQVLTAAERGDAAQHRRHIARQDHPLARAGGSAGLDSRADRHADARHAGSADHAAVLHPADSYRDGVGHARQSPGRPAQPALPMGDGIEFRADQCLLVWRRGLAHDAVFRAVPVPAHRRRVSCDGPEPRGGGADVRRVATADVLHRDAATDVAGAHRSCDPELHSRHREFRIATVLRDCRPASGSSPRISTTRSISDRRRNTSTRPPSASSSWRCCS